ncbi:cyclic diguanosine monophosphate-binding protein [Shewanella sp. NFH-SH190041]|uniref:PilZ domain-containing protein n=1 Tax=Shewanella sp. NFH-SH190041 TaxID=2950245 RepID=UPI0021C2FD3F|nr:PilZ domain-containing protein [Shewanella sp. NFH-SH190041]BDM65484.1 cyclic diguanosine monophosphate-binding protein [Shewanella sp. NFH-SH190041]
MNDRRRFSRILFATPATLSSEKENWHTKILDLSLNGALIEKPANYWGQFETLRLDFQLPESNICISIAMQPVHETTEQLGLKCLHIDLDSISHLRHMVAMNKGDSTLLSRELDLFIHQRD